MCVGYELLVYADLDVCGGIVGKWIPLRWMCL